jgi:hypothetical protein
MDRTGPTLPIDTCGLKTTFLTTITLGYLRSIGMGWVKLPVLNDIYQKFENIFLRKTGLTQRFRLTILSRAIFPDLEQRLETVYLTTNYGTFLWEEARDAHHYRMDYRARKNSAFRKLFRIDVDSEDLQLISAPDGLE